MLYLPAFTNGFALSATLVIAIGAQNTFVLRQGLRREHVWPIVAFCAIADVLLVAAGVAGLGVLLKHVPALALILTLGGVVFLVWYGYGALRRAVAPSALVTDQAQATSTLRATIGRAAAFTFLNPHVYLDTVLLMGAVGIAQPAGTQSSFVIGSGVASASWFVALGFGARLLVPLFARPLAWRVLDGIIAAMMLSLALGLLVRVVTGAA